MNEDENTSINIFDVAMKNPDIIKNEIDLEIINSIKKLSEEDNEFQPKSN